MMETKTAKRISSYLTFKIGDEEFAANVNSVLNILEVSKFTKIPKSPDYLLGVINQRGSIIPVVDARRRFGMKATELSDRSCIVVIDLEVPGSILYVGLLVETVEAVWEIDEDEIQLPPGAHQDYFADFITGLTRVNDRFIMILDLHKLFTKTEIHELQSQTI